MISYGQELSLNNSPIRCCPANNRLPRSKEKIFSSVSLCLRDKKEKVIQGQLFSYSRSARK